MLTDIYVWLFSVCVRVCVRERKRVIQVKWQKYIYTVFKYCQERKMLIVTLWNYLHSKNNKDKSDKCAPHSTQALHRKPHPRERWGIFAGMWLVYFHSLFTSITANPRLAPCRYHKQIQWSHGYLPPPKGATQAVRTEICYINSFCFSSQRKHKFWWFLCEILTAKIKWFILLYLNQNSPHKSTKNHFQIGKREYKLISNRQIRLLSE